MKLGAARGHPVLRTVTLLEPHPCALARRRIDRLDVADVDCRVLLNPAALRCTLRRPDMLPHSVDSFHHYPVLVTEHAKDLAGLALVGPGNDYNRVASFNVPSHVSPTL